MFTTEGWKAVHWSDIGDRKAADTTILEWARTNGYIVFTHDLDFGALLAATRAQGPSVIQLREQNIMPEDQGEFLVSTIKKFMNDLRTGALISVDKTRSRARILPLKP